MPYPRSSTSSRARSIIAALAAFVAATALAVTAGAASATSSAPVRSGAAIVAADYDLGVRRFPQPQDGRFARMPIRLWGTIAAPASGGPHPVVLVAHGAHGDNCPTEGEFDTWPCWSVEKRSDLGFRYLVRSLARAGFVAVAMDVSAAYTGGWGESANQEERRFGQVLDATLAALEKASTGAPSRFGVPLSGKLDPSKLAVVGHSRGGMNVLRWGKAARPRAVFLVAPFFDPAQRIQNVPTTVLLGTCDFDTRREGAGYVTAAAKRPRTTPVLQLTLGSANHNFYNQTLVRLRQDDADGQQGRCAKSSRLTGSEQQAFLARVAVDHFASNMLGAEAAAWLTGPVGGALYGRTVAIRRVRP